MSVKYKHLVLANNALYNLLVDSILFVDREEGELNSVWYRFLNDSKISVGMHSLRRKPHVELLEHSESTSYSHNISRSWSSAIPGPGVWNCVQDCLMLYSTETHLSLP